MITAAGFIVDVPALGPRSETPPDFDWPMDVTEITTTASYSRMDLGALVGAIAGG